MSKLKIVVLDGFTLNPGDLSWQPLMEFGDCDIYPHTLVEDVVCRARSADIILTNKTVLSKPILQALPQLKYIGVLATGTNVVDLVAASEQDIKVTNVPAYGPDAVAQMVFAHILQLTQQVSLHHQAVSDGAWSKQRDFCFTLAPLMSLKGKMLGLVGYGDIAKQVARIAVAFGMQVLVNSVTPKKALGQGIRWCHLDELLTKADFVSLHCPLTANNQQMINAQSLALIKPQAMIINTARGGLINEQDLADWLNQDKGFAGVDVLSSEPPAIDNPLLSAKNITITPHIAWATVEARQNLLNIAVSNLESFIAGKTQNRVI